MSIRSNGPTIFAVIPKDISILIYMFVEWLIFSPRCTDIVHNGISSSTIITLNAFDNDGITLYTSFEISFKRNGTIQQLLSYFMRKFLFPIIVVQSTLLWFWLLTYMTISSLDVFWTVTFRITIFILASTSISAWWTHPTTSRSTTID